MKTRNVSMSFLPFMGMLAVLIALTTCRLDLSTDIYLSDITDATQNSGAAFVSAVVSVSNPDEDKKQDVIDLLNTYFLSAENIRVENRDSSDYMVADVKLPVFETSSAASAKTPFEIAVDGNNGQYDVYLQFNKDVWKDLNDGVSELFGQGLNIKESELTFRIINDFKTERELKFSSVYVDGTPMPYVSKIKLERKKDLSIKLSNVLQDTLEVEGVDRVLLFSMTK